MFLTKQTAGTGITCSCPCFCCYAKRSRYRRSHGINKTKTGIINRRCGEGTSTKNKKFEDNTMRKMLARMKRSVIHIGATANPCSCSHDRRCITSRYEKINIGRWLQLRLYLAHHLAPSLPQSLATSRGHTQPQNNRNLKEALKEGLPK